jgi:hypothetical protein
MSPISVTNPVREGGSDYTSPFVGPVNHTAQISVDITALTDDEIDADGYLKPGVPLKADGTLVSGSGETILGVTIEPLKVAKSNSSEDIAAATSTFELAVATIGQVSKPRAEENLGRSYTSDEVDAFAASGLVLLS